MARARNIKPSFFTNEILGTLDPFVGLTFAGLWCLADKDGILQDRPVKIKGELFPHRDGLDVNGYLTVLHLHKFIVRYVVDNSRYIKVLAFNEHQHPHHTEKAKGYPQPPAEVLAELDLFGEQPLTRIVNGYGTEFARRSPSDSGFLIPENGECSSPVVDKSTPVDNFQPPPISDEFREVLKTRPDLPDPGATWLNFQAQYPQIEQTLARWRKWVATEHGPSKFSTVVDIAKTTVPAPPGRDPTLEKLDREAGIVKTMPAGFRQALEAKKRGFAQQQIAG